MIACLTAWVVICATRGLEVVADDGCSGTGANPWVYNFEVDGMPAKVINDAEEDFPIAGGFYPPEEQKLVIRSQRLRFLNDSAITADVNVLYINTKDGGILFDTGSGPNQPSGLFAGTLFKSLDAEGISQDSIKKIFLTHADVDHIGGVVEDFQAFELAFPHATVYISKQNFDFFTTDPVDFGERFVSDEQSQQSVQLTRTIFQKLGSRLKKFDFDEEIIPGVKAISTPWHMPGHVSYVIKDGDSAIVFAGDALTIQTQSIEDFRFKILFDVSASAGPAGRAELLDMIAEKRWKVLTVHGIHPALTHVRNLGLGFEVIPVQYRGSVDTVSVCS